MNLHPLILQGIFGLFAFLFLSWIISENKKEIDFRLIIVGLSSQILLTFLIFKVDFIRFAFRKVSSAINSIKEATLEGTSFVFGYLGGGKIPFLIDQEAVANGASEFIFAFKPLPMLMVISALSMLLFHWKILPFFVKCFSWVLRKSLNIGGALGVCAAAKVFLGQTDAPLLIRPYLGKFSRSELFTVMTAGMATTSATIIALYATILDGIIVEPISHILTASVIGIPAAITISRIMIPHTGEQTSGNITSAYKFKGAMDALSKGTIDGLWLFLNIIAMLIVALTLVTIVNNMLGFTSDFLSHSLSYIATKIYSFFSESHTQININLGSITLQKIFGLIMAPFAWFMGISWQEIITAGGLLGTKTALNELVAFINLSKLPEGALSEHSRLIMTYALCGFANLSSIGIQIAGLGTMVPERRIEIISLAFRALIAGTIASCMSGTIVGLIDLIF